MMGIIVEMMGAHKHALLNEVGTAQVRWVSQVSAIPDVVMGSSCSWSCVMMETI